MVTPRYLQKADIPADVETQDTALLKAVGFVASSAEASSVAMQLVSALVGLFDFGGDLMVEQAAAVLLQ